MTPSQCPICKRIYCDHTHSERGQTFAEMMGDTVSNLKKMRKLHEAATIMPWRSTGENVVAFEDDLVAACGSEQSSDDSKLIVANRNMLPLLLDLWTAAKADNVSPILLQEALYHLEKTNV